MQAFGVYAKKNKWRSIQSRCVPQQYVCNMCLNEIKKNRFPRRSRVNRIKFATFPKTFIEELKKTCMFRESTSKFEQSFGRDHYEESFFKLNRLESYLLKLVIPFIRVVHCPRGPFLKVKGDLILITSDLEHSLSKILLVNQDLLPVCFKRKLAYTGSFIEEYIEGNKVEMYFRWLKKHNNLFKDVDFDKNTFEKFLNESLEAARTYEEMNMDEHSEKKYEEEVDTDVLGDELQTEVLREPVIEILGDIRPTQTTMFMNKYSENPSDSYIADRLATMIVEYETANGIRFDDIDDFDIDDEIIDEELFLTMAQNEMEKQNSPRGKWSLPD